MPHCEWTTLKSKRKVSNQPDFALALITLQPLLYYLPDLYYHIRRESHRNSPWDENILPL